MKTLSNLVVLVVSAVSLLGGAELRAQKVSIQLESDIRVFSMLAALRQAGLDLGSSRPHPVQKAISQEFRSIPSELKEKMQQFYQSHTFGTNPEELMSRYISLALLCEGPPDFKLSVPLTSLPPDAESVYGFLDLVEKFYAAGRVEVMWSRYRHYYDDAIVSYRPVINQIILTTDGYLRIPSGSYLDRQLFIIPELLVPPNSFNARTYRDSYYLVFGPSERLKTEEIRHQYLHFILDHYALRYTLARELREALGIFVTSAPEIEARYRNDLQFLVTESLIRAVELRMGKVPDDQAQMELNGYIRSGALLARHFYDALPEFESSGEGLRVAYPNMIKLATMEKIEAAFTSARSAPQPAPPAEPSELTKLLRNAEACLGNNEIRQAKDAYQQILDKHDATHGAALYGLGIAASMENDRPAARDYFQKALQSPSSDKPIKVWAHIYLARLHDVEGNRQEAIQQYQAALAIGDNTRNAQAVAQQGLDEPFRSKKQPSSP